MWKKIVKWSIYLLVFLMPLFWLPFSFEPFGFNKTYLLFFLSSIGLLAWLAQMVFEEKKVRFKKSPLDIFVLAFLLITILNGVFSIDRFSSWFGFYGRFWPNIIGSISLIVFYFLLTNNVSLSGKPLINADKKPISADKKIEANQPKPASISGILKIFLWSVAFVVLISYFSLFGVWSAIGKAVGLPGLMFFKTFNPIGGSFQQLAVFLSFVFVLLLSVLAFSGNLTGREKPLTERKKRNFWNYCLLAAIFVLLLIVDFWPSWLIVSLSLVLFLGFSFWKRVFREDVNRLSLSVLFLIISLVFLFSNPLQGFFRQTKVFNNLPEEIQLSQGLGWKIGLDGLKENAVLGVGMGNFSYLFSKYKPVSFVKGPFWQIRFDRASNNIAERIGTTGVLGILGYLSLIGMFLIVSWIVLSYSSQTENIKIQFPLVLAFFALLVGQFVFYQNATLSFSFWLFMALGTISWGKPQKEKTIMFRKLPELGLIISILFWVVLLGIAFLYFTMAKFYIADVYYKDYLISPANNLPKLEKAVKLNSSQATYHMALAGRYLGLISEELAKPQPDKQKVIQLVALSIKEGRTATQVAPKRIAAQETLGVVYRDIQGLAQGALEWGINTFKTAIKTEPNNPVLLTELGKLLVVNDKKDQAKNLFNQALKLRDNYVPAVVQLANLAEKEGKKEEGIKMLEDLVKNNKFSIDAHFQLGRMYYNEKYYKKAAGQFQSVLAIFPNHSNALYSLGLAYEKLGEKKKAIEEFQKVLKLNPDNKLIENEIEKLRTKGNGEGEATSTKPASENK